MQLRIAVELSSDLADVGDLLADAQAFEAAGADTLWLAPTTGLDPWSVLGALAATTHRVRLATLWATPLDPSAIDTACRTLSLLSRGRFVLAGGGTADVGALRLRRRTKGEASPDLFALAPDAAAAERQAQWADGIVHVGDPETARDVIASAIAARTDGPIECWVKVALPESRTVWREACAAYMALGATGVILPQGPRSLDLVRNPDVIDDRSDLRLTQG